MAIRLPGRGVQKQKKNPSRKKKKQNWCKNFCGDEVGTLRINQSIGGSWVQYIIWTLLRGTDNVLPTLKEMRTKYFPCIEQVDPDYVDKDLTKVRFDDLSA